MTHGNGLATNPFSQDVDAIEIRRELPVSPEAAALARQALDGWLSDLVGHETAQTVRVAASELIDNVVRHAALAETDVITLAGVATEDIVRIEIEQASSAASARIVPIEERGEDGGYGLQIVDALTSQWGIREGSPGAVWFEVDRDLPAESNGP
jgi:anti-sigma regulatory factor (Ser/Thr protein kinase)